MQIFSSILKSWRKQRKMGRRSRKYIIKFQRARISQMRKTLTLFRMGEVYFTTSPEEGATLGPVMLEEVRRGERYYLRWEFLPDNPTVELRGSAFLEACFLGCFQVGALISRRYKVGPP